MRPYGETPKKYVRGCRTWRRDGRKILVSKCVAGRAAGRRWSLRDETEED